jgi:hypothetical protein
MPGKIRRKTYFTGDIEFSGDNDYTGNQTVTGNQTITGDQTVNGDIIGSNSAGTGAGTIRGIQAQALTVKTQLPTTTGAAGGTLAVTGATGAAGATTTAGGAGAAVTITSGSGGAKSGTGAAAGGAAGTLSLISGTGGATASSGTDAGGVGAKIAITAGNGGASSAGTGNGGDAGSIVITAGTGGTTTGGTAGLDGVILNKSLVCKKQGDPVAETGVATLSAADLLSGIITITHTTGATVALTTCTGAQLDAALPADFGNNDSFDFSIINLSAAAADTATLTAGAPGITLVGAVIIPSAHSTTIVNSSMTFRARKTASDTFTIYRIA